MYKFSTFVKSGLAAVLASTLAMAEPAPPQVGLDQVMDQLVADAMAANLELAGAEAGVAQRLAQLDQARARYLPAIDLNLRYSVADGGRQIEIPVGDLLNPVYASLNSLLAAGGQPAPFSPVANASIPFLRDHEQESVLRLTQPLYDGRIRAAAHGASFEHEAARLGRDALVVRLRRDMQQAYLRWLSAREAIAILDATLEAARENQRVNESLYRNGRVTRDAVLRAETDVLEIEQQAAAASAAERAAQNYVNLLRNRPLESALIPADAADRDVERLRVRLLGPGRTVAGSGGRLQEYAVDRRHELRQVDAGLAAADAAEDLARAAFKPRLALAVDTGIQGQEYGFSGDDRFTLASLVLQFNLFRGGADRAGLREARARTAGLQAWRELLEQQVRLEVLEAARAFDVAEASLRAAARRVEAAGQAFEIVKRKRDLGQLAPVEFIDARRALTGAELSQRVHRYQALVALTELDYAMGGAPGVRSPEAAP